MDFSFGFCLYIDTFLLKLCCRTRLVRGVRVGTLLIGRNGNWDSLYCAEAQKLIVYSRDQAMNISWMFLLLFWLLFLLLFFECGLSLSKTLPPLRIRNSRQATTIALVFDCRFYRWYIGVIDNTYVQYKCELEYDHDYVYTIASDNVPTRGLYIFYFVV